MAFFNRAGSMIGPSRLAALPFAGQRFAPAAAVPIAARYISSSASSSSPPPPLAARAPAPRIDLAKSFEALAARAPQDYSRTVNPIHSSNPAEYPRSVDESSQREKNPDAWWRIAIQKTESPYQATGDQFSGRFVNARPGKADFTSMYRTLSGIINRCGIKKDLRLMEFHEKSSDKRRRLASERHRRRFQEKVRQKVHIVLNMQNRNRR